MANTIKNKKTAPPPPVSEPSPINVDRKRQVRLGFGIFFMLTGIFTCLSIISYCFTWATDQDKLISKDGIWHFLLHDHSPVANWGGRLGAAISHILVYKGAGIASFAIGLAVTAIGMSLIYGKRVVPLLRYMRWLSILLILAAPILTYLFRDSSFPLGGALGNVAIDYLNGLIGNLGTGMALLSTVLFFVFVIFALDIRPFLRKMQQHANKMAASLKPEPVFNTPEPETAENEPFPVDTAANHLNDSGEQHVVIDDTAHNKEWEMALVEKRLDNLDNETDETETPPDEDIVDDEQYEEYKNYAKEREAEKTPVEINEESGDPGFTFVVKQEDAPIIKHGAHISIADNEPYAPEESLRNYKFPTLDLLEDRVQEAIALNKEELERNKDQIINTLRSFGIEIKTISATVGPTVTLYE